jgi:hypothetical protein
MSDDNVVGLTNRSTDAWGIKCQAQTTARGAFSSIVRPYGSSNCECSSAP